MADRARNLSNSSIAMAYALASDMAGKNRAIDKVKPEA
jgi:hypothetical protein